MKTLLITLFSTLCFYSSSQTITDQMGGVDCNFTFTSNSYNLDVIKQTLLERPKAVSKSSALENESYGYAYAYTEWHLEFVSNTSIKSRERNMEEGRNRRQKYHLEFYNKTGDLLMETYISKDKLKLWQGKAGNGIIYTYSLNLINVPLILLDNVTNINIEYIK